MPLLRLIGCSVDLETGAVQGLLGEALTDRELGLLRYLSDRPGADVPKDTVLADVFGYAPSVQTRAVDKTLVNLRKKVEVDPAAPDHVLTVRGVGYRFEPRAPLRSPALPEPGALYGRERERKILEEILAGPCFAAITGPAGVGKTSLALALAHGRSSAFCSIEGLSSRAELVRRLGERLELPLPAALPAATLCVGRALSCRGPLLLVLDAIDDLHEATDAIRELRALAPELRVLATARAACDGAERQIVLGPLERSASVALLSARAEVMGMDVREPDPALASLAELLGDLPLALVMASGWLEVLGPAQLLERYQRGERPPSLQQLFDRAVDRLAPDARRALAQLSVFRGPFDVESAAEVLSRDQDPLLRLRELVRASLVCRQIEGGIARLWLLAPVRWSASDRLAAMPEDLRTETLRAYVTALARLDSLPVCRRHSEAASDLAHAVDVSASLGDIDLAIRCLSALRASAALGAGADRCVTLARSLLDRPLSDRERAAVLVELASALQLASRPASEIDRALREAEPGLPRDGDLAARAALIRGQSLASRGCPGPARDCLEAALAAARAPAIRAHVLRDLGDLAQDRGQWEEARERYEGALALYRSASLDRFAARAELDLAITAFQSGDLSAARRSYLSLEPVFASLGDRRLLASVRGNLGNISLMEGDLAGARAAYLGAIAVYREIGDIKGEAQWLYNLANIELNARLLPEARATLTEIARLPPTGVAIHSANVRGTWGRLLSLEGKHEAALVELRAALRELDEAGDGYFQIAVRVTLAATLDRSGRVEEALAELATAEQMAAANGAGPGSPMWAMIEAARAGREGRDRG